MNSTALALIEWMLSLTTIPPPNITAAVGIIAVAYVESGLNTGPQTGNTGGVLAPAAYGLFSDNGARQQTLKTFALNHGWDGTGNIPADLQVLNYLNEMANSYPTVWAAYQQVMSGTMDINDWITVLVNEDEIPANPPPEILDAQVIAASWLASGQITQPSPTPAPTPSPTPAPTPSPTPIPVITQLETLSAQFTSAAAQLAAIVNTLKNEIG